MRFADIDMLGHVNHARYLGYLEEAHLAFITSSEGPGFPLTGVIIARWEIDYVHSAVLSPEPLTVSLWVNHVGRTSFALGYTLEQDGQVAARASSVIVSYDHSARRPRHMSPTQRAGLERFRRR